ncbi:MAG: hypothetical protein JSS00_04435 [Proteobacteria bacterium]|nr:hypothetical protein [Pseudomonadota bacterium]
MHRGRALRTDPNRKAAPEDIRRTLGVADDRTVMEILALQPSLHDVAEAALWQRGDSDFLARERRKPGAAAQGVIDILARNDEEWADDERR